MTEVRQPVALLSVYNKEAGENGISIVDFASALVTMGWKILSTGGTGNHLRKASAPVTDVSDLVGNEIMGGRVKTLSREVHAGLLARDTPEDWAELERLGIPWIDLVCVDMYPLEEEIRRCGSTRMSVIEKTDVGGPTMIHAGAKGQRIVVCDPADRDMVLRRIESNTHNDPVWVEELAGKAEYTVARYLAASAKFRSNGKYDSVFGEKVMDLKYGENPHQRSAALFSDRARTEPLSLSSATLVGGAKPSLVLGTDCARAIETAVRIGAGYEQNYGKVPLIAVAVKHGNACGAAVGEDPNEVAWKVIEGDPLAVFGAHIVTNFPITQPIAEIFKHHKGGGNSRVLAGVMAPSFGEGAVEHLSRKDDGCRLSTNQGLLGDGLGLRGMDNVDAYRMLPRGEFLRQSANHHLLTKSELGAEVWDKLEPSQFEDLILAWAIGCTSNSNTIILTKNGKLIGPGVGQQSRVEACKIAVDRARSGNHDLAGAVAYSDGFFPFEDGPEVLAEAGVTTILAPSGSRRDKKIIEWCRERNVNLAHIDFRGFFGH